MATELAKAYVQIIPSAEGIQQGIADALDGVDFNQAEEKGKGSGNAFGKGMAAAVAGTVGKAAVQAAGKFVGYAKDVYGEFQQVAGGVDVMFGESAELVKQYAGEAFKTAGLSANEYMKTVTGFSASLISSLGGDTETAAKVADMAINDMADNASAFGEDMGKLQKAYQGFAAGNYRMLDSLHLGYDGSKTEMQRLLADASALAGVEFDIGNLSDVYEAIHVIQEQMELTGHSAEEAGDTMSGSAATMKAAWENLVVGVVDGNGDIAKLIDDFNQALLANIDNIMPVITSAIKGLATLIRELAPELIKELPGLIDEILPPLLDAAYDVIMAVLDMISDPDVLVSIGQMAVEFIIKLAEGLVDAIPKLMEAVPKIINGLVTALLNPDSLGRLVTAAIQIIGALVVGIIKAIPELVKGAFEIIKNLAESLLSGKGKLREVGRELIRNILEAIANLFVSFVDLGKNLVQALWEGIKGMAKWLWDKITGFFSDIVGGIKSFLGIASPSKVFMGIGENMALGIGEGFDIGMDDVNDDITDAIGAYGQVGTLSRSPRTTSASFGNWYVTIDAKNVHDFTEIVDMAHNAKRLGRMYA